MKKQNNDNNLLSDIEFDIESDWESIVEKTKEVERKAEEDEKMKNPQRFLFPDFEKFYSILFRIRQSWGNENLSELHELLAGVFYNRGDSPMPNGFNKMWEIFCDPRKYRCKSLCCAHCHEYYDIFYETTHDTSMREFDYSGYERENMTIYRTSVFCPKDGSHIAELTNANITGVFRSDHDGEKVIEYERFGSQFRDYI